MKPMTLQERNMKLKLLKGKAGKVRIYSAAIVFLLLSFIIHLSFPLMSGLMKHKLPNLKALTFHFMEIKHLKLWFYSEIFAVIISAYVWIISDKQYVSDEIQVTDKIRIPAPAGQGQYGSARFATSKEIDKFFNHMDFALSAYKNELSHIYKCNDDENIELAKITVEELAEYEEREILGDIINYEEDIGKNENNIEEIVKYAGDRKDIRFILKSKLSLDDLKRSDIKDIEFDEYYAKLNPDEFNEVVIAINKVRNTLKKNLIYEHMVKKRYESIEQLKEIRYAIEDGISGGFIQLFADNTYSADKLKQIRLAYKSEKISNKRLIEKYMLNPRLTRNQMEEIRKALIQDMENIEGLAHDEIPEELMRRLREIGNKSSEKTNRYGNSPKLLNNEPKAIYNIQKENGKEEFRLFDRGGLVLGKENLSDGKERIYSVNGDLHSLALGGTGDGKTRRIVLQSIVMLGLAGENMIVTDIKREVSEFTATFLKNISYRVVFLDFNNPLKSTRINFLAPVIDAVNKDDIDSAVELIWDITTQLVGETKGEPIWQNGEASIIAGAIMAVVYDNRDRPECQNFANVYHFLSEMCKPIQIGKDLILPINEYTKNLDDTHPAKGLFAIGEIAPSRTRGSFYTSALTTLRLFTSMRLSDMTSQAEFKLDSLALKKTVVFIILPEDRDTYNQIAALYVGLQYQALSKMADRTGGRLKIRCNYFLEELGNYPKIPNFLQMITVSRGKGIRFNLFLQDLSQLVKIYGKEGADTIYGNCQIWIYLGTENKETLELISAKLSQYTVYSYSVSGSTEIHKNASSSFSRQLSGRNLLYVNELALFSSPYSLVLSKINPAIMKSDDFSKWQYVKLLNMGSKDKDIKVRYYRQKMRKEHMVKRQEYWNIKDETISNMVLEGE